MPTIRKPRLLRRLERILLRRKVLDVLAAVVHAEFAGDEAPDAVGFGARDQRDLVSPSFGA